MSTFSVVPAPDTGLWRVHRRGVSPLLQGQVVQAHDPLARPTLHATNSPIAALGVSLLPFQPSRRLVGKVKGEWVGVIPESWFDARTLTRIIVPPRTGFIDAMTLGNAYGITSAALHGPPAAKSPVRRLLRGLAAELEGKSIGGFTYPSRFDESWRIYEIFEDQLKVDVEEATPDIYRASIDEAMERLGMAVGPSAPARGKSPS